ncbi:hypothetical protein EH183_34815 [Streptomyces sp. CB01881]|nr:hypothetical protein C2142_34735 [Streptomyces sp. CB01881]TYC69374.1 hypothetical protein EH183_34815 [Streptomyces sp. CB01881]
MPTELVGCERATQLVNQDVAGVLTDDERAAVDDGQAVIDQLLARLTDVPSRAGPTPRQLGIPATVTLLSVVGSGTASSRRGATKSRSQLAAPTEGRSVTSQPAPDLASLYPELGQDGTLQIALQKPFTMLDIASTCSPNERQGGSDQELGRIVTAGRRMLTWASRTAASS